MCRYFPGKKIEFQRINEFFQTELVISFNFIHSICYVLIKYRNFIECNRIEKDPILIFLNLDVFLRTWAHFLTRQSVRDNDLKCLKNGILDEYFLAFRFNSTSINGRVWERHHFGCRSTPFFVCSFLFCFVFKTKNRTDGTKRPKTFGHKKKKKKKKEMDEQREGAVWIFHFQFVVVISLLCRPSPPPPHPPLHPFQAFFSYLFIHFLFCLRREKKN